METPRMSKMMLTVGFMMTDEGTPDSVLQRSLEGEGPPHRAGPGAGRAGLGHPSMSVALSEEA